MTDSDYTADGGVTPPYKAVKDSALSHPDSRKKQKAKSALLIFLSAFVYSASFHYFVAPSNFVPSGVGGAAGVADLATRLIASGLGGVCCGVSLWLALKANASTGGTVNEIVGKFNRQKD